MKRCTSAVIFFINVILAIMPIPYYHKITYINAIKRTIMKSIKQRLNKIGVELPSLLVPSESIDARKWAVVACDQYTSQKSYWEDLDKEVEDSPSTLRMIYPECYLGDADSHKRIVAINKAMESYCSSDIFKEFKDSFMLVRRTANSRSRWGLMVALDLERYSWEKSNRTLIRATEGTILSRIPPRKEIRKDAPLEVPHILVLISDEARSVIEPLANKISSLEKAYDTDLMKNGGHLEGWAVNKASDLEQVTKALEAMEARLDPENPLLFAMGDGNHSFATAKSCWEDIKKTLSEKEREGHPARYCLVELENIFDEAMVFEPIHRVLFKTSFDQFIGKLALYCDGFEASLVDSLSELEAFVSSNDGKQKFGLCKADGLYAITLENPVATIAAGTLQNVIDDLGREGHEVDYIHGSDVTNDLGRKEGNLGLILPAISKATFFDTIIKDGALPRKTFSMGEANEKRYYFEARKIR